MHETQSRVRQWLHEPLLHFLLLGMALFLLSEAFSGSANRFSDQVIRVNRTTLARHAMTQRLDLGPDTVNGYLDGLLQRELDALIDSYVDQEVLVREARALGLDDGDPVVRQRLVSKLRFLLETIDAEDENPSDSELQEYYEAHAAQYQQPALLTFSHVFFDYRQGGKDSARRKAQQVLQLLNDKKVAFGDGPPHGDAFHYQPSYIQRSQELITNHFSVSMAATLWTLPVQEGLWQGPLESPYGLHVVMISNRERARVLPLSEVRAQVRSALLRVRARAAAEAAMRTLLERYTVEIDIQASDQQSDPPGNPDDR